MKPGKESRFGHPLLYTVSLSLIGCNVTKLDFHHCEQCLDRAYEYLLIDLYFDMPAVQ